MLPYWLIFGLFAVGSLGWKYKPVNSSLALTASAIILTLFIGLRYEVGTDWESYLLNFNATEHKSFSRIVQTVGDPGYYFFVWLAHRLGFGIWAVNLACSAIFVAGLLAFSKRTPNPWLSMTVAIPYLVIVVAMSGVRQATAIGICFFAFNAFSDRRLIAASLWIMAATLFHASAIVMLGIAALSFSRDRFRSAVIVVVTAIVCYFVLRSSLETYAYRYSKDVQSSGTIFRLIMNFIPAAIFLIYKSKFEMEPHEKTLWRNMALLSIICFPLLFIVPSSTALDRFSLYLIPIQCLVLSSIGLLVARRREQIPLLTLALLAYSAGALIIFLNYASSAEAWKDYQFYPSSYSDRDDRILN